MVVDDGIGTTSVSEDGAVQFPDVLGLQFPQPQAPRPEKGIQPGGDEPTVALVSGALDGGRGDLQPVPQEVGKQLGLLPCLPLLGRPKLYARFSSSSWA